MKTSKIIPLFELETLYRIMLLRIAKGFSAGQLSFLIGAAARYVEEVEALQRPFYSGEELQRIELALEDCDADRFFPAINDDSELHVSVHKKYYKDKWIHTYCSIGGQNEEEQLFVLREDVAMGFDDMPDGDDVLAIVEDTIDVLVRSGYFYEAKLPYEIFQAVHKLLPVPVSPFYIYVAMMRFTRDEGDDGPLKLVGDNGAALKYEEC